MLQRIFQTRFLVLAIVLFTIINAIAFVVMGVILSVEGITGMFKGEMHTEAHPGLKILESLDVFLIALVFLIFAMGIATLFLDKPGSEQRFKLPSWLNISNFTELKLLLWEAVLTTLVVYFVSAVVKADGDYQWELLIIPGSIVLLSLAVFVLRKE